MNRQLLQRSFARPADASNAYKGVNLSGGVPLGGNHSGGVSYVHPPLEFGVSNSGSCQTLWP